MGDAEARADTAEAGVGGVGTMVTELASVPPLAILDEARLAALLHVTRRTVRRMVQRHELPPPVRLAGRSCWLAGRVLDHIGAAAERAAREAERQAARIRAMTT